VDSANLLRLLALTSPLQPMASRHSSKQAMLNLFRLLAWEMFKHSHAMKWRIRLLDWMQHQLLYPPSAMLVQ
jgi:hypothetical protein